MSNFSLMEEKINSAGKILILTHINPDGDALGSVIAMKCALKQKFNKTADVVYIGKYPDIYNFLPHKNELIKIEDFNTEKIYDIAIALDVASKDRMSAVEKTFNNAKYKINIDHHKTNNNYGEFNLVDGNASSTGEVLFRLFETMKAEITKDIAIALYTSILTDTGCFKYNSTTPKALEICSKLVEKGIDCAKIALEIYGSKPKSMVMINAYAVSNAKFLNNDKIAYSTVTLKDLEKFNADSDHTEGIVESLKEINSVEVAILFKELKNGFTKVSFRSKNIDVAKISSKFDGGGHTNASGCTIKKPMTIAIDKIIEELREI